MHPSITHGCLSYFNPLFSPNEVYFGSVYQTFLQAKKFPLQTGESLASRLESTESSFRLHTHVEAPQ